LDAPRAQALNVEAPLAMLAATLAIELPLALLVLRSFPVAQVLAAGAAASLLSHPLACMCVAHDPIWWFPVEVVVVALEAILLRTLLACGWRAALLASLACNVASATVGWLAWPRPV
jgi:hypothetical protein